MQFLDIYNILTILFFLHIAAKRFYCIFLLSDRDLSVFICYFCKKTMVDIIDLARYTILRLLQNGNSINPLKLQKILYYLQAWYLVYFDKRLLFNDIPEAWVSAPVYRVVYDIYKDMGIYEQFSFEDILQEGREAEEVLSELHGKMNLSDSDWEFIEAIYKHYGVMSHDYLVYLTHSQKPWNEARRGLNPFEYSDQKISLDLMYDYYSEMIKK